LSVIVIAVIGHQDQPNFGHNLSDLPQYFVDQLDQPIVAFKISQISRSADQLSSADCDYLHDECHS